MAADKKSRGLIIRKCAEPDFGRVPTYRAEHTEEGRIAGSLGLLNPDFAYISHFWKGNVAR